METIMKLVHKTKTSLGEQAKQYYPQVKELYPYLDEMLLDRISKYCVVYLEDSEDATVDDAVARFEQLFREELT